MSQGLATVSVGPKSVDGMIAAGRKVCKVCICRANSCGWDIVRLGVRCEVDKEFWDVGMGDQGG